ncbi:MAG: PKD domain-containing protein [Cytophagales bacterium]|nr:PKD domain-containing protein [Cytophagales bacterium]
MMKKLVLHISLFLLLALSRIQAQVVLSGISTINGICTNSNISIPVPNITFTESVYTDMNNSGSYVMSAIDVLTLSISAPAGFSFDISKTPFLLFAASGDIYATLLILNSPSLLTFNVYHNAQGLLDALTLGGISILASTANTSGMLAKSGSLHMGGITGNLHTISSVLPSGLVLGLNNKYCGNELPDTLSIFPTGSTFVVYPSVSGVFTQGGLPSNRIIFHPSVYVSTVSATNLTINYNFPDLNGSGCTTQKLFTTIEPKPAPMAFIGPEDISYELGSTQKLKLKATPTSGGTGLFQGPGVSDDTLFLSAISTLGDKKITYKFTNTITGCADTVSKTYIIFDPNQVLEFSPPPLLSQSSFCVTDNIMYSMAISTNTGIPQPQSSASGYNCGVSRSFALDNFINSNGPFFGNGIICTNSPPYLYTMSGFRFQPSAASPGIININYTIDYEKNLPCIGAVTVTSYRKQTVTVHPKPSAPVVDVNIFSFCSGSFVGTNISITANSIPGYYKWYRYAITSAGTLLITSSALGINTASLDIGTITGAGNYYYAVSKVEYGCEGDLTTILGIVKPIPAPPVITNSTVTLASFCKEQSINPTLMVQTVPGATYKWYLPNNSLVENNDAPTYTVTNINNAIVTVNYYFASINIDQCESPKTTFSIVVNDLPPAPSIISGNSYCQFDDPITNMGMRSGSTLVSTSNVLSVSGFRWYVDAQCTSVLGFDSTGTTIAEVFPSKANYVSLIGQYYNTSVTNVNFFVKTRSTVGCLSKFATPLILQVKPKPPKPNITNFGGIDIVENEYLGREVKCVNTLNNTTLVGNAPLSIYTWYHSTFIPGWFPSSVLGFRRNGNIIPTNIPVNLPILDSFLVSQTQNGCNSDLAKIKIHILDQVLPPIISSVAGFYCTQGIIPPLTAFPTSTLGNVFWFRNAALTDQVAIGSQLILSNAGINLNIPGTHVFYAEQKVGSCRSSPLFDVVTVTIRQKPPKPITGEYAYCVGNVPTPISVSGAIVPNLTFEWYNDQDATDYIGGGVNNTIGGLIYSFINPSVSGSSIETVYKYARENVNGCVSDIDSVKIDIIRPPNRMPVNSPLPICNGAPIPALNKVGLGQNVRWYLNLGLNTLIGTGNILSQSNITLAGALVNTTTGYNDFILNNGQPRVYRYYSTQTTGAYSNSKINFPGCQSLPVKDSIVVYPVPYAPNAPSPAPYCSGEAVSSLSVTGVPSGFAGFIFKWYNNPNLNNFIGTSDTIKTNFPESYISNIQQLYYVTQSFNNCQSAAAIVTITGNPLPIVNFSGLANAYCEYNPPFTITGIPLGGMYTTSFSGFSDFGNGVATISPAQVYIGSALGDNFVTNSIIYTYIDANGCKNINTKSFTVNKKPIPRVFIGANDSTSYCNLPGAVNLLGYDTLSIGASSNTFKLNTVNNVGISGNSFYPSDAGDGTHTLTFKLTVNSTGCTDSVVRQVTVRPQPKANFQWTSLCLGDLLTLTGLSTVSSGVIESNWKVTPGESYIMANPILVITTAGNYRIALTVTSNNCSNVLEKNITLGPYPMPDFYWKSICLGSNTQFTDSTSLSVGNIASWYWDFGVTGSSTDTSTKQNPIYKYTTPGTYYANLIVTSDKNCTRTLSKKVDILPVVALPYSESFDNDAGGWFAEGTASDWVWGASAKSTLNTNIASDKYWVTGISNDSLVKRGQSSWVNSPCMDFSTIQKPMLTVKYKNNTNKGVDGAVIQYSLDDGNNWTNLGDIINGESTGVNWFNTSNIFANPGKQRNFLNGWSDTLKLTNWTQAKHIVDNKFIGVKNVRFRVAFATTANTSSGQNFHGFAFNDFTIKQRSKITLLEQFNNNADGNSAKAYAPPGIPGVREFINDFSGDLVAVSYHINVPGSDEFNLKNPADPEARALYYNIKSAANSVLNGNYYHGLTLPIFADSLYPKVGITPQKLIISTLQDPSFTIDLQKNITNSQLTVSAKFTSLEMLALNQYTVHLAVVERTVSGNAMNGITQFEYVLHKMLPDAGGSTYNQAWNVGDNISITQTWNIPGYIDVNRLGVIAFIQNKATKEILQTSYQGPLIQLPSRLNEVQYTDANNHEITLYPNPASHALYIKSASDEAMLSDIAIYNQWGTPMIKINDVNKPTASLDISSLTEGIYIVKTITSQGRIKHLKFVKMK